MNLQAVPTPLLVLSLATADAETAEAIRAELARRTNPRPTGRPLDNAR